jgi:hypothetical protein
VFYIYIHNETLALLDFFNGNIIFFLNEIEKKLSLMTKPQISKDFKD